MDAHSLEGPCRVRSSPDGMVFVSRWAEFTVGHTLCASGLSRKGSSDGPLRSRVEFVWVVAPCPP